MSKPNISSLPCQLRAEEEAQLQTEELQTITEAMTAFFETGDWQEATARLLGGALRQTESEYGFVGVVVDGPKLRILAHQRNRLYGKQDELCKNKEEGYFESTNLNNLLGDIIKTGKAVLSNAHDPIAEDLPPDYPALRNFLAVPILKAKDVVGLIAVSNRYSGYSAAVQAKLEILAQTVGVMYDSYRRSEREEALRTRIHQLEKIDAVGRVAAGLAHDFNNILMVISGYSEILLSKLAFNDDFCRDVMEIQKAAGQGSSLTRQLLAFSMKQPMELRLLDLNEIIRSMQEMLQRSIGEDIELQILLDPQLRRVKADQSQMEQVIMNLTVNARDAMPQGGRLIVHTSNVTVDANNRSAHPEVIPGAYSMLTVQDTGCGMDDATKACMFEPFFTTKEAGKGTGIGLATVLSIIEQGNGHIFAESRPGSGTIFQIYLPQAQEIDEGPGPSLEQSLTSIEGAGETILLVDDSDSVRVPIAAVFAAQGYNVLEARNAAEALILLQTEHTAIQLMVTDVIMPGLSGYELALQAKAFHQHLKVIYISGYSKEYLSVRLNVDSSGPFISKPMTMEALLCTVREVLDETPMLSQ